jgi:hypothetical protein
MTVSLTIEPELEERVVEAAKRCGVSVEEFAQKALAEKAQVELLPRPKKMPTKDFLKAMAYRGPIDSAMANQEITREFIYGDHP